MDGGGFVAGEAEVDEPFLIQPLRCLFQQLDLLQIVFDEIIVGGKNISNSFLDRKWRLFYFDSFSLSPGMCFIVAPVKY